MAFMHPVYAMITIAEKSLYPVNRCFSMHGICNFTWALHSMTPKTETHHEFVYFTMCETANNSYMLLIINF